jgi:predicted TIM-barrel fold metal-dependent hydrolase
MGRVVISMDSHTELVVDVKPYLDKKWHEEFDRGADWCRHVHEKALDAVLPLMLDVDYMGAQGVHGIAERAQDEGHRRFVSEEYRQAVDPADRLVAMDRDGVAAEFIVPFTSAYSLDNNPEFLHALTQAYHRYYVDHTSMAPWRFTGSTVVNFAAGMDVVLQEVEEAHEIGLRGVSLAGNVRTIAPDQPEYNHPYYDPLWAALSERNMSIIFHSGLGREKPMLRWQGDGYGWQILHSIESSRGHHVALQALLAGAVTERFPGIHVGILESGTQWIPKLIEEVDRYCKAQPEWKFEQLPSEQWANNYFVSGTFTREDLALKDYFGVQAMCWGSDYPHVESSWPNSPKVLAEAFAGMPDDEIDLIVGGNAARIIGYDLEKLATTPAAQVEWPEATVPAA